MRDWVRHFGMPRDISLPDDQERGSALHDRGSEFIGADFLTALESLGALTNGTPAYSPQSHGQVERANRSLLESLRDSRATTVNETDVVLSTSSNVLNNTLTVGGFTPAQLVFGRSTTMHRNVFDDTPESALVLQRASAPMQRLLMLQDDARAHVTQFVHARKVRQVLAQAIRPQPLDFTQLKHGEYLLYWRPRTEKAGPAWRGPARFVGHTPHCVYLDHGGAHVSAHPTAVRLAKGDLRPPDAPMPQEEPGYEELDDRDRQHGIADAGGGDFGHGGGVSFAPPPPPAPKRRARSLPPAVSPAGSPAKKRVVFESDSSLSAVPASTEAVAGSVSEEPAVVGDVFEPEPLASIPTAPEVEVIRAPLEVDAPDKEDEDHPGPVTEGDFTEVDPIGGIPLEEHGAPEESPPDEEPPTETVGRVAAAAEDIPRKPQSDFAPRWGPARAPPAPAPWKWEKDPLYPSRTTRSGKTYYATARYDDDEWNTTPSIRQRRITADAYHAILMAEAHKYTAKWEDVPRAEQLAAEEKHYGIWTTHEVFDKAQTWLPPGSVSMDGRWVHDAAWGPDGKLKGKARFTPRGFQDHERHLFRTDAPTIGLTSLLTAEAYMQSMWDEQRGIKVHSGILDISAAFYQGEKLKRTNVWMQAPPEWYPFLLRDGYLKALPKYGEKVYLHLEKDAPGTGTGPRSFHLNLDAWIQDFNKTRKDGTMLTCSKTMKPALYRMEERTSKGEFIRTVGTLATHVDDIRFRSVYRNYINEVVEHLKLKFIVGQLNVSDDEGVLVAPYLGFMMETDKDGVRLHQHEYIEHVLKPIELPPKARKIDQRPVDATLQAAYGTGNGRLQWVVNSRPEIGYPASRCASKAREPNMADCFYLNEAINYVRRTKKLKRFLPTLKHSELMNIAYADASLGNLERSRTQGGRIVGLEDGKRAAGIVCRSGALKRVTNSSFDGETISAVDCASDAFGVSLLLEDLENGPRSTLMEDVLRRTLQTGVTKPSTAKFPTKLFTDGEGTVKAANGTGEIACKRRSGDVAALRESLTLGDIEEFGHIPGDINPADPLTKKLALDTAKTMDHLRRYLYEGIPPPMAKS